MGGRSGLALAIGVVALLAVAVLGLLTATLPTLGSGGPVVIDALRHLPALPPGLARSGQRVIEAAAVAAVIAALLAVPCGLALSVLPPGLAWLGRSLLAVPAWSLATGLLVTTALLLPHMAVDEAAAQALGWARRAIGLRGGLAAFWLPILAGRIDLHARHVEPAQARALSGLGVSPLGRVWRLTLPAVAWPLASGAIVAFAATAVALFVVGRPTAAQVGDPLGGVAALSVVAALALSPAWAAISRPR